MGRRGAPKPGEAKSALAKTMLQKKVLRKNGASIAAQKGVDKYGKDGKKFNSALALKGPASDIEAKNLKSVMEMASMDEFLMHAKLTKREFEARRGWFDDDADSTTVVQKNNVTLVGGGDRGAEQGEYGDSAGAGGDGKAYEWHALPMPERPPWSHSDTAPALERREVETFVDWRRRLAATEERVMAAQEAEAARSGKPLSGGMAGQAARMTPYEKNMEVWRQLWRVVERSDVLVQVVDSRQPLFYYSQELHEYARSHFRASRGASDGDQDQRDNSGDATGGATAASSSPVTKTGSAGHVERLMVLNKADFLTSSQRRAWSKDLRARGLRFVWFSAKLQQEELNAAERLIRDGSEGDRGGHNQEGEQEEGNELEAAEQAAWKEHMSTALDGGEAALTDDEEEEEDDDEEEEEEGCGGGGGGGIAATEALTRKAAPAALSAAVAAAPVAVEEGRAGEDGKEALAVEELSRVIGREELLRVLEALSVTADANRSTDTPAYGGGSGSGVKRAQVGIVGYPNVGKSSVINVLLGATPLNHSSLRVATGATPGKTKHFQTLDLPPLPPPFAAQPDDATTAAATTATLATTADAPAAEGVVDAATEPVLMTLCDCPGLVFPQFVSSAAEMLLAGVLPVAQLRDHNPPMRLLCSRVPKAVLELTYGFKAPKVGYDGLDSSGGERADLLAAESAAKAFGQGENGALCEFLTVEAVLVGVGRARSWFASGNRGEVDRSRVARHLLTGVQTGKLLACLPPPTTEFGSKEWASYVATTHKARLSELKKRKGARLVKGTFYGLADIDDAGGDVATTTTTAHEEDSLAAEAALAASFAACAVVQQRRDDGDNFGDDFGGGGDGGSDDEQWMETELDAELHGEATALGKVTRYRGVKNAKMERRAKKEVFKKGASGKKGRKTFGEDPYGEGGDAGVHAAGRKANHGNSAPLGLRGSAVLPHHPSYGNAAQAREGVEEE